MEDFKLVFLINVAGEIEAKIILAKLESFGIKAMTQDKESGEYIKIIMGSSPFGVDIFVTEDDFEKAYEIVFDKEGESVYEVFEDMADDITYDETEPEEIILDEKKYNKMVEPNITNFNKILWTFAAIGIIVLILLLIK